MSCWCWDWFASPFHLIPPFASTPLGWWQAFTASFFYLVKYGIANRCLFFKKKYDRIIVGAVILLKIPKIRFFMTNGYSLGVALGQRFWLLCTKMDSVTDRLQQTEVNWAQIDPCIKWPRWQLPQPGNLHGIFLLWIHVITFCSNLRSRHEGVLSRRRFLAAGRRVFLQTQVGVEGHAAECDDGSADAGDPRVGAENQVAGEHDDDGFELAQHNMRQGWRRTEAIHKELLVT